MILSAIAAELKSRSKDDFKGRHFEAGLIIQVLGERRGRVSSGARPPLAENESSHLSVERSSCPVLAGERSRLQMQSKGEPL